MISERDRLTSWALNRGLAAARLLPGQTRAVFTSKICYSVLAAQAIQNSPNLSTQYAAEVYSAPHYTMAARCS